MGWDIAIEFEGGRYSNKGLFKRSFDYKGVEKYFKDEFPRSNVQIDKTGIYIDNIGAIPFNFEKPGYLKGYTVVDISGGGTLAYVATHIYIMLLCDMKVHVYDKHRMLEKDLKEVPNDVNTLNKIFSVSYKELKNTGHNIQIDKLKRSIKMIFK